MPDLSAQMDAVCHRFEELSVRLNQPDAAADPALFRKLMRDYHETQPVVQAYRDWQTARDHLAQAKALLEEPISDPDFKQMIQQEISEKSQDVAKLENNLKILLLPRDPRDEKNVIMEIRGGAGGEEAALFAHSLLRMYTMYVQSRGWTLELLNLNETELGGVKEAVFSVEGAGAYNRLKYESGVHRVQRVPETETQGRIHTSTATVAVMPQAEEVDFALPYMNVALGVISPDSNVITTLDNWNADDQMIVISGTTAETYLTKEYPDIPLQKYDSYATAKNALENGNGVAWANDNTEVIAFAKQNTGYTVGIPSLGSQDTIAPAVSQGNTTVLDWLNEEIKALGEENFFHKDYEETLVDTYGLDYEDELVVEGGVTGGADAASSEDASSEAASSEAAASEVASSAAAQ